MKVAVLGAGGMGGTVIEHLQSCPDVTQIVAQDIRPARVEELQKQYGIESTTDLHAILNDPRVLTVFITASNDAHANLAMAALKAGKAVMCEKPMATTLDDARCMMEYAESINGFLQIGFELRYSHLYTNIKKWIDAGLLGKIINTQCLYIASAWEKNTWRAEGRGGGMFGEKLSHYVDLPRWWVGDAVKDVMTVCAPNVIPYYAVRDNYHTTYRFQNGAVSHLTFMMAPAATFRGDPLQSITDQQNGDGHELRFIVQGTEGAAQTDVFGRTLKRWRFGDAPDTFTSTWEETLTWTEADDHFWYHNTHDQTHDIVRRVQEGLPPSLAPRDAYETMRLCFAAESSAETGEWMELDNE